MNSHKDTINTLVNDGEYLFSGGRDGIVKAWKQDFKNGNGEIKCFTEFEGNSGCSSVNALCTVQGNLVASANSDRSIRIWR